MSTAWRNDNDLMKKSRQTLSENEVLVSVKRVGICGTDIHAYGGNQPFFNYPRVLGHELSGVVEKIGANVTKASIGDHILLFLICIVENVYLVKVVKQIVVQI